MCDMYFMPGFTSYFSKFTEIEIQMIQFILYNYNDCMHETVKLTSRNQCFVELIMILVGLRDKSDAL